MKRHISILKHMLEDITDINDFTKGVEFDTFVSKNILKKSFCMSLINIGELAKALPKEFRSENNEIAWKNISGLRDIAALEESVFHMEENIIPNNEKHDYQHSQQQKIVAKLKPIFVSKPEIVFAYLFGSVATGKINKFSDIDLAVFIDPSYLNQFAGYDYQSELIAELSAILNARVDLVILNDASTFLCYQVLKNGLLLISRSNEERRAFHEKTMRSYLDLKPLLKVQRDYMIKRLAAGTFGGSNNG